MEKGESWLSFAGRRVVLDVSVRIIDATMDFDNVVDRTVPTVTGGFFRLNVIIQTRPGKMTSKLGKIGRQLFCARSWI